MLERPSQRVSAAVGTWTRKAISQTEFCVGSRKTIAQTFFCAGSRKPSRKQNVVLGLGKPSRKQNFVPGPEKPSRKQDFVPGPEKPSRSRRSWDRPLVQLRRCSLVILYSAHGLCSLLTPRTIYMHSVSPTTMLFSSGRNQLVVWWRTTSFARQGSRNAYVASAILALLSELTTSMTEYHQNDIPLVCIGVDLP